MKNVQSPKPFFDTMEEMPNPFKSPVLDIDSITILERCIYLIIKSGAKKIFLNTFHLGNQILEFIQNKKFPIDIQIIEDGNEILDTGGGILNMIKQG